jgi:hypothetical protein
VGPEAAFKNRLLRVCLVTYAQGLDRAGAGTGAGDRGRGPGAGTGAGGRGRGPGEG